MLVSWKACLAAGAAATAGYVLLPAGRWPHAVAYGLISLVCLLAVVHGVRRYRPQHQWTWYAFIGGLGLWLAGGVIDRLTAQQGRPAASVLLELAGYPFVCAALAGLVRGRAQATLRTTLVDAAVVATSLGLLYWTFAVGDAVTGGGLAWPERLHTLFVAAGDITLFALGSLLVTTPGARTASYRLLLAALLTMAFSDILAIVAPAGQLSAGGPADVASLAGNTLVAAAALHPSMRRLTVPMSGRPGFVRPRLALLTGAVLLAPAVGLYEGATGRTGTSWLATGIGCITLFLLVTVRLADLVRRVESQAHRLDQLAHSDALTGLANRRRWDERLPAALAESAATGETLYVALLDLDHFKHYNDTHGHQAGDDLLAQAAAAWRRQLRAHDLLARYGGEEFGLLLTARTDAEATEVLERLLAATPYHQTFSAGLARWDGTLTAPDLVHRADELLYASKNAGRARITVEPAALPA